MKNFSIMAETGYPVCFDATHSIQLPTSMEIFQEVKEVIPILLDLQ